MGSFHRCPAEEDDDDDVVIREEGFCLVAVSFLVAWGSPGICTRDEGLRKLLAASSNS